MVLWEITLATAYFLGLKRTYKLALRIQRRIIGPNHPRIRHFLYRRMRAIFGVAITVHRNIQQRDIEVGRNLGNWVLRWLDRMKPSAQIRGDPPTKLPVSNSIDKQRSKPIHSLRTSMPNSKVFDLESDGHHLFMSINICPKSFPTLA